jgi:hypothetical protein
MAMLADGIITLDQLAETKTSRIFKQKKKESELSNINTMDSLFIFIRLLSYMV